MSFLTGNGGELSSAGKGPLAGDDSSESTPNTDSTQKTEGTGSHDEHQRKLTDDELNRQIMSKYWKPRQSLANRLRGM